MVVAVVREGPRDTAQTAVTVGFWTNGASVACRRATVYGPFYTIGGGGTVPRIKLLKKGRLSGHRDTVC